MKRIQQLLIVFMLSMALFLPSIQAASSYVNFNFDQVKITHLIHIVGELTGKRFVLGEDAGMKVSVITPEQIPLEEVYPLFLSILESNGLTVVEKGQALHILSIPGASRPSAPVLGEDEALPAGGLVTKVLRLKHVNAVEVRSMLVAMSGKKKDGGLLAFGPTNHLIVTDTVGRIRQVEALIASLDQPDSVGSMEVITLKHASARSLSAQISAALKGAQASGSQFTRHLQQVSTGAAQLPSEFLVVPNEQSNSLIVIGTPVQIGHVKRIVAELDVESAAGRGRLNAIFLKYSKAEDLAKNLNGLLAKAAARDQVSHVAIEPSIANNALLVDASPIDFEYIKTLVEELDQVPQQVLVEILIAEIAETDSLDLGVEWATIEQPENGKTTFIGRSRPGQSDAMMDLATQGVFPQGMLLSVARGTYTDATGNVLPRIPVLLRALAEDRNVKILSNVPLWAQNNMEATVSVVQNIPILSSTIEGGAGTSRDVIQNIERMDVGIELTVTPLVNPNGEITLTLNPKIEAIISQGTAEQPFTPTIAKREVSTTVTIPNDATVAISGLIREDVIQVERRVPVLGSIPLLGALFRSTENSLEKTNLMIFVTPHIVTDMVVAKKITASWTDRAKLEDPVERRTFADPDNEGE